MLWQGNTHRYSKLQGCETPSCTGGVAVRDGGEEQDVEVAAVGGPGQGVRHRDEERAALLLHPNGQQLHSGSRR